MKICLITTSYPRWKSDPTGPFIEGLCKPLANFGNEVNVIAPSETGTKRKEEIDGVKIHRAKYWFPEKDQRLAYGSGIPENIRTSEIAKVQVPFLIFALVMKAWPIARESDIIHAHWPLSGLAGVVLKKLLKRKLILTIHGAGFIHPFIVIIPEGCETNTFEVTELAESF